MVVVLALVQLVILLTRTIPVEVEQRTIPVVIMLAATMRIIPAALQVWVRQVHRRRRRVVNTIQQMASLVPIRRPTYSSSSRRTNTNNIKCTTRALVAVIRICHPSAWTITE